MKNGESMKGPERLLRSFKRYGNCDDFLVRCCHVKMVKFTDIHVHILFYAAKVIEYFFNDRKQSLKFKKM